MVRVFSEHRPIIDPLARGPGLIGSFTIMFLKAMIPKHAEGSIGTVPFWGSSVQHSLFHSAAVSLFANPSGLLILSGTGFADERFGMIKCRWIQLYCHDTR
jgi:hypothetical protein